MTSQLAKSKNVKTWSQLKQMIEYSRKFLYSLNNDVPTNISFREYLNSQTGKKECRVYFLASGSKKRDTTIKYVTIRPDEFYANKIAGNTIFLSNHSNAPDEKKLTKEEQLLRERKRCSFSGITSYSMSNTGRFVFSERSELFFYEDQITDTVVCFVFSFTPLFCLFIFFENFLLNRTKTPLR
jgi:hypothetical protein